MATAPQRHRRARLLDRLRARRFTLLLAALGALLVVTPVLSVAGVLAGGVVHRAISVTLLLLALVAAAHAVIRRRRPLVIALTAVAAAMVLESIGELGDQAGATVAHHVVVIGFLAFVSYRILRAIFRASRVDAEVVAAAVCLYLAAGVAWALVFSLSELLQPGGFSASFAAAGEPFRLRVVAGGGAEAFYFSFVTLTTLGYGDIVPATGATRTLAVAEALMGQLYLGVLVARVVGLQIAHGAQPRGRSDAEG